MAKIIIWDKDKNNPLKVIDTDAPENLSSKAEQEKIRKSLIAGTIERMTSFVNRFV